jgi:hypothetical protein
MFFGGYRNTNLASRQSPLTKNTNGQCIFIGFPSPDRAGVNLGTVGFELLISHQGSIDKWEKACVSENPFLEMNLKTLKEKKSKMIAARVF